MDLLEMIFAICCVFLGVSIVYSLMLFISFIRDKDSSFDVYIEELSSSLYDDLCSDKNNVSKHQKHNFKHELYAVIDDTHYKVV